MEAFWFVLLMFVMATADIAATTLKACIDSAFQKALEKKYLFFYNSTIHLIPDRSINYRINLVPALLENKPDALSAPSIGLRRTSAQSNPFLPCHPDLLLPPQWQCLPHHNLVLNKYSVTPGHFIIATKEFQSQLDSLNSRDFEAIHTILHQPETLLLFFYNQGVESGASQPHKHIQAMPVSSMMDIPIHKYLQENLKDVKKDNVFQLPSFPFLHAACYFSRPEEMTPTSLANWYQTLYSWCAQQMSVESLPSHNVLITKDWMLVVPRSSSKSKLGIPVNSLGFAGMLLAKSNEELELFKNPLEILKEVTVRL